MNGISCNEDRESCVQLCGTVPFHPSWLSGASVPSEGRARGTVLGREAQGQVRKPQSLEQLLAG